MPKSRAHLRSSRRVPPLKDTEIDHEIDLVDHAPQIDDDLRPISVATENTTADLSTTGQPLIASDSRAPLTQNVGSQEEDEQVPTDADAGQGPSSEPDTSQTTADQAQPSNIRGEPTSTANGVPGAGSRNKRLSQHHPHPPKEPETEIDILYENQRGGFLCGIPLFASAALGNLDPPAWTNFAHKPSPTDINTAQVPDPSWEWAWPEWRINHDEAIQCDSDGWEYSFMFSKKFSWHGPKWYSSYVRRRAWIRRRVKKGVGYQANDPHLMNPEYFSVTPAKKHHRTTSMAVEEIEGASITQQSRMSTQSKRMSREMMGDDEDFAAAKVEVKTAEALMPLLRRCRIDREKLEVVESYIENCTDDLLQLQDYMHEIMSIFVFQASRKLLLTRLTHLHDDEIAKQQKGKSAMTEKGKKAEHLAGAIKHADEEVRRLEYWSDIKEMAENGESGGAVDGRKGWDEGWEGLDKSGAKGVKEEDELP